MVEEKRDFNRDGGKGREGGGERENGLTELHNLSSGEL